MSGTTGSVVDGDLEEDSSVEGHPSAVGEHLENTRHSVDDVSGDTVPHPVRRFFSQHLDSGIRSERAVSGFLHVLFTSPLLFPCIVQLSGWNIPPRHVLSTYL